MGGVPGGTGRGSRDPAVFPTIRHVALGDFDAPARSETKTNRRALVFY